MVYVVEKNVSQHVLTLAEFVDRAHRCKDLHDYDELLSLVPDLQALARNQSFYMDQVHRQLRMGNEGDRGNPYAGSSLIVHEDERIFMRMNFWTPAVDTASGTEHFFAYDTPHDHNYDFLTVGCLGPGYRTPIYEYDRQQIIGFPGEVVDLRYIGDEFLTQGRVLLFRKEKDVHVQIPPDSLSVSLNVIPRRTATNSECQYVFDLEERKIVGYLNPNAGEILARLAASMSEAEAQSLLKRCLFKQHSTRARASALKTLGVHGLSQSELQELTNDSDKLIRRLARQLADPVAQPYEGAQLCSSEN